MKKFIYFIVDINGKCLQVVNGTVQLLSTLKQLSEAPDGNQEIAIGWERSALYHGNIRNFSLELGFVMSSAFMLRDQWYKYNLDLRRFLLIKRLTYENTLTTFKEYYKQLYKGELDFSTGDDSQGEYRFNIGIMEGGLQKLLKANEGTDYEIPFDIDAKNVIDDGIIIDGNFKWLIIEYISGSSGALPTMVMQGEEHAVPGIYVSEVMGGFPLTFSAINETNTEYFLSAVKTPLNGTARVYGQIVLSNALPAFPMNLVLWVYNTISATLTSTPLFVGPEAALIVFDIVVPLVEGDRWFLEIDEYHHDSTFNVEVQGRADTSIVKGFTIYDLGIKLLEKMGIPANSFESTLLAAKNIILTSGDGIRGIEGAAIKTNWREYWKAVDVYCKAQLTITDKIRIEERHSAYDSTKPAKTLGIVKDFKCTYALDMMWTSVKVGHADPQTDDTNGKYDFNSHLVFTTPIKGITDKQLDLQTNYKASPWEIETMRANYEGKITTDKGTDNDVYALAVLPDLSLNNFNTTASFFADGTPFAPGAPLLGIVAPYPLLKPGMVFKVTGSTLNDQNLSVKSSATWFFGQLIVTNEPLVDEFNIVINIEIIEGQYYTLDRTPVISQLSVPDVSQEVKDSIYNVPLSPKRLFNLHKGWIAGALVNYSADKIVFASSLRNKELIADGIIEKADVVVNDLGAPDFLPRYFEFDTISPVDMTAELQADPNPIFEPTWNDNNYTGFFIRGGIALNDLEEQTFKLLACPENNLLNLI